MADAEPGALPQVRPAEEMTDRYYDLYCAAGQMRLSQREHARRWYALGVPAEIAGSWARFGCAPEVGWKWMCEDWTPEMVGRLAEEVQPRTPGTH